MDRLNKLNQKCSEIWTRAMNSESKSARDKLLEEYRRIYEEYKKHREWIKLLEV